MYHVWGDGKCIGYRTSVENPERKRALEKSTRRWEDKFKYISEKRRSVNWINLAQDRGNWRVPERQ
jgi:hypothetical protein